MSEVELSKAEKLKRRQEQLAKWKLKKVDSPQPEATPTPEISPEEQKRIDRQAKLEQWKLKKRGVSETPPPDTAARQLRLEEWKRKRLQSNGEKTEEIPKVTGKFTTKLKVPLISKKVAKRAVFDSDEEDTVVPQFKKPTHAKSNYNMIEVEEVDSLDVFLESLKSEDNEMSEKIIDDESALEDSFDEDEEQDKLISLRMKNLQNEKELAAVDHSSIDYIPFRRNFYVELQIVKDLTEEEVQALRIELEGIKVTGKNCPRPIWNWSQLGLSSLITSIMENKLDYKKPTAIQSQALPAIMSGRDVLGIAKTGSGKTLAFVLPLLKHVQDQPPLEKGDGPIGIILSPTRELAVQIYKQLSTFTKKLGISACCCYGGSSIEPQIAEMKRGAQIVVSTPGRLIDLLAANGGRVCNLRRVTYVVLDEADRMFDFGFEPQVNKIFSQVRPDRQSILFSATFARKMEALAKTALVDPVEIVVGAISVVAPEITQRVELFEISEDESPQSIATRKFSKLVEVLGSFMGVKRLIFVEKQDSADDLLVKLLAKGIPSLAIHGGKEQIDRKYAIKEFSSKDSGVDVLIATSIAARGLDVKGLDLVVNYDPANHMEDYVHRVGRTGRAGNKGDAWTFVTSLQERPITDLVKSLRLSKVPEEEIDPRLIKISEAFLLKVKSGTEKFRFGFGGKGLNNLDEIRNTHKLNERKMFDAEPNTETKKAKVTSDENGDPVINGTKVDLPEFKVIEGRAAETSGPDRCKFHSRVTINDLPQKARWIVMNADGLSPIIEATSTSITNKGQYYPPGAKVPATVKQGGREVAAPPKLYLLIEGLTENSVYEANKMIRQKMIEGLEAAAKEDIAPTGKYTV